MLNNDSISKLECIFHKLNKVIDFKNPEIYGENLTSKQIRLKPRDLLYLFFEVEKEFGIRISESQILEGKFKNINGIFEIIECGINKS